MKKIILLIILLIPMNVKAQAYIVMDTDNNRVLEGSNIHTPHLIASTTKIMTSIVVLNNSDINTEITLGDEILKSYGSGIYCEVGEKLKIKDLLYGLMLRSGNDAAMALEHHIGGSKEGFAKLMNETATSLNMKNTNFLNSHGLEENDKSGNKSTVYDMGLLTSYALTNKDYKTISGTKKYKVTTNYKTYLWHNKNKLLNSFEYTTGGKTGFTELAKRTLVTTASKDNINLAVITFKDSNDFANHKSLYNKYFNELKNYQIIKNGSIKTKYKNTYIKKNINMSLTKDEYKKIDTKINYYENNATNIIGEIEVSLKGKTYIKENIYQKEETKEKKLNSWQKFIRKIGFNG